MVDNDFWLVLSSFFEGLTLIECSELNFRDSYISKVAAPNGSLACPVLCLCVQKQFVPQADHQWRVQWWSFSGRLLQSEAGLVQVWRRSGMLVRFADRSESGPVFFVAHDSDQFAFSVLEVGVMS